MVSKFHQRVGTAGLVLAMVALVAALGGGAYAASGGLTAKQKKEVTKIAQTEAKKYAGKQGANGATGPAGPTGTAGAKGDNGAVGEKGSNGTAGVPGEVGPAGPTETTLPPGKTETGDWSVFNAPGGEPFLSISFQLRAGFEPLVTWVEAGGNPTSGPCKGGSSADPIAEPGNLCIFAHHVINLGEGEFSEPAFSTASIYTADPTSGFVAEFVVPNHAASGYATGSWALTAFNE
jgi:hypothetical protein